MRTPMRAALVALAVVVAAPAARAFTLDDQSGNTSDESARFTDPNRGASSFDGRSLSRPLRSRADWFDPTRDPDRLPPVPQGARIGAGEHGFGNNSRFGYDRSGRPR